MTNINHSQTSSYRPCKKPILSKQSPARSLRGAVGWGLAIVSCAIISLFCFATFCSASAANIYIAQNAVGAANGTDCADAFGVSFFNNAGNWGTGAGQIGPGTTVHLCGTFTDVQGGNLFTAQGSGAAGNPVTIICETGCVLQSPAENNFFNLGTNSHFILDGGFPCGWVNGARVTCNGLMQNTLNGASGQTCPGGPCSIQLGTTFISPSSSATDLEVRNWQIGPAYIHGGTSDTFFSSPGPRAIQTVNQSNIHNNIFHDFAWVLNGQLNNITIAYNEFYNLDHGFGGGCQQDTAITCGPVTIHDNYEHDFAAWDQTNNAFHHDGYHVFAYCGSMVGGNLVICPNTIISGVNVYNNRFGGDAGTHFNAEIFFEGNIQNGNIFNNVSAQVSAGGGQLADGFWNGNGYTVNYFNNTAIGISGTVQTYDICGIIAGTNITVRNNACVDAAMMSIGQYDSWPAHCPYTTVDQGTVNCFVGTYTISNDAYLAGSSFSNAWNSCTSNATSSSQCTSFPGFSSSGYASFIGKSGETGSVFENTVEPKGNYFNTTTGQELTGSPTIGAGVNLTSLCTGLGIPGNPCLYDIVGNPRPSSGAWDIGAYQGSSGGHAGAPAAPTGLVATVD